jgi:hypothetical protein
MKKLILLFLFSACVMTTFAQFKEPLTKEQLQFSLEKADKMKSSGTILCFLGGIGLASGVIMYISGLSDLAAENSTNSLDKDLTLTLGGIAVGVVGIAGLGVGIPFAVAGSHKKNNIELELMRFKGTATVGGVGFKIRF